MLETISRLPRREAAPVRRRRAHRRRHRRRAARRAHEPARGGRRLQGHQSFLERVKEKALGEQVKLRARSRVRRGQLHAGAGVHRHLPGRAHRDDGPVDTDLRWRRRAPPGSLWWVFRARARPPPSASSRAAGEEAQEAPAARRRRRVPPGRGRSAEDPREQLGMPCIPRPASRRRRSATRHAGRAREERDVVIFDTAGRLAIDEPLSRAREHRQAHAAGEHLPGLRRDDRPGRGEHRQRVPQPPQRRRHHPHQARRRRARRRGPLDQGGHGKPIKFLGMGESLDKLEESPRGLASRILGMGDIVGLVKDFEEVVDAEKAERRRPHAQGQVRHAGLPRSDSASSRRLGSLKDIFEKMPFFRRRAARQRQPRRSRAEEIGP